MAITDLVQPGSNVAFDTDALIYYVEEHEKFLAVVEPLFNMVVAGEAKAHASVISLLEVLVQPLRQNMTNLARQYRELMTDPDAIALHPLTASIAERAAAIRAAHNTEVSVIAATAIESGCQFLVTNNGGDFAGIEGINVLLINSHL